MVVAAEAAPAWSRSRRVPRGEALGERGAGPRHPDGAGGDHRRSGGGDRPARRRRDERRDRVRRAGELRQRSDDLLPGRQPVAAVRAARDRSRPADRRRAAARADPGPGRVAPRPHGPRAGQDQDEPADHATRASTARSGSTPPPAPTPTCGSTRRSSSRRTPPPAPRGSSRATSASPSSRAPTSRSAAASCARSASGLIGIVHRYAPGPARRHDRGHDQRRDLQGVRLGPGRRVRLVVRDRVHRRHVHGRQPLPAGARPRGPRARHGAVRRASRPARPARSTSTRCAGGYATTNNGGLALGLLGGMQPGGTPRDRCGPPATEPAAVAVPQSTFFQGNTRPDTGAAFDVGIGLHKSQLGAVRLGRLRRRPAVPDDRQQHRRRSCRPTRSALLSRSLGKLVETNSPMAIGLRPQSPPTITLGKNTFTDDAMGNTHADRAAARPRVHRARDRLLRRRSMTSTSACSRSSPTSTCRSGSRPRAWASSSRCSATSANAFTNVVGQEHRRGHRVADRARGPVPEPLEPRAAAALGRAVGASSCRRSAALNLAVTDITAVDNDEFLAIFANLVTAMPARPVDTQVDARRRRRARPPRSRAIRASGGGRRRRA